MKRAVFPGITCLLLASSIFAQGGNGYVKVPSENIRNAPSGSQIGELQAGTRVEILERKPKWTKVRITGWIWDESLTSDSTLVAGFTIRASHILVKTEAEAASALNELKAGADFAALAKKLSIDPSSAASGGDVGEFKRGDLMPEFESAVLKLKVGQISGPVKSEVGVHLIQRTK